MRLINLTPAEIRRQPIKIRIEYFIRLECHQKMGKIGPCTSKEHSKQVEAFFNLGKDLGLWEEG